MINGFGNVVNIACRQTAHVDATVTHQVDRLLLDHPRALVRIEPGKAEHADLIRNVRPRARRLQRFQALAKARPHEKDARRHGLDVVEPFRL